MDGYGPSTYGDRFADIYDAWYPPGAEVDEVVATLARLAGSGPVIELGCGTGRLAVPLAALGVRVVGIDASPAMLDLLRAKNAPGVIGAEADMSAFDVREHGPFTLAFVVFNTLFGLTEPAALASCFATVSRHLAPGGRFVVECFVPEVDSGGRSDAVEVRELTADRVVLRVSRHDEATQTLTGQHVDISETGIRLRPWHLRYAFPDELDRHAGAAGLTLESRWSDWRGAPFGPDSGQHVTIYRLSPT